MPIFSPCCSAKTSRSGRRAISPSSRMISQITDDGLSPAIAARSQPASVWPARISTPPSCACSGKMWPGWTRSSACASRATAACTVRARSAAEMPVRDAGGGLDRDREGGAVLGAVAQRHRRQAQALAAFARQGQADQAAAEPRHEVDRLGRDVVGGQHQVAFVLAVFLVDEDHHAAGGELGHEFRNGRNRHDGIVGGGCGDPGARPAPSPAAAAGRAASASGREHALDVARDLVDLEVDALSGRQAAERGVGQGVRNQVDAELAGAFGLRASRRSVTRLTVRLTPLTVIEPL